MQTQGDEGRLHAKERGQGQMLSQSEGGSPATPSSRTSGLCTLFWQPSWPLWPLQPLQPQPSTLAQAQSTGSGCSPMGAGFQEP